MDIGDIVGQRVSNSDFKMTINDLKVKKSSCEIAIGRSERALKVFTLVALITHVARLAIVHYSNHLMWLHPPLGFVLALSTAAGGASTLNYILQSIELNSIRLSILEYQA